MMGRVNFGGLSWFIMVLVPVAFLLFPNFSLAQEVQRVYQGMDGLGNDLGYANLSDKSSGQQLSKAWTRPEAPLRIASTYEVTTNADTGVGSFRRGIDSANKSSDLTAITFSIGSGVQTITPRTSLPQLNYPVIIDGTTQPGFAGTPIIEINGGSAPLGTNGLFLVGGNSIVRGLVINRFRSFPVGGNGFGIVMDVNGGNVIQGNYIGLNVAGTDSLPNGSVGVGIFGTSAGNTIGGTTSWERNVISGNRSSGVALSTTSGLGGNVVQGNYIGTDATGGYTLGNRGNGIFVNSPNSIIGGLVDGSRNIVSGNVLPGIFISPSAISTVAQGNYVGTDVTGSFNLGNGSNGINVRSSDNIIGDISEIGRNIIAGSASAGLYVFSPTATRNKIINNLIGTDVSGTVAFANNKGMVFDNAPNNIVGGETTEEGNLIAGNLNHGVDILNAGAAGNKLLNNFIGTNWYSQSDLGNSSHGIKVSSSQDTIKFNTIAHNSEVGVFVSSGTQNMIRENSIFSNWGMAIDLAPAGLTINDSLDNDTGPNNLQNFPILDSARVVGDSVIVFAKLDSKPNAQYQIDFYANADYDASHFGEGARWLHREIAFTDGQGRLNIPTPPLFIFVGSENYITATATDAEGNTSEFSQALCLLDSDSDGIPDSWEMAGWGIDVNSDGIIDQDLSAIGADPYHKDLFVEVDAMEGMAPHDSTLVNVTVAFALSGNGGIDLHITKSHTSIPLAAWPLNWWTGFHAVKGEYFGTVDERDSPNARFILEAKKLVYRYCIFAYQHDTTSISGRAEDNFRKGCDDFMVTLGLWSPSGGSEDQKAGTFMHELGHTLGLGHGGVDGRNYKPNYISIMNYAWQTPFRWGLNWRLDYSREALATLNESALDEFKGLNIPVNSLYGSIIAVPYSGPGNGVMYAKLKPNTPVDWDSSGSFDFDLISADLNSFSDTSHTHGQSLLGQDDWSKLVYNFRNSPDFSNASRSTSPLEDDEDELNFETFQFLDNLPPPKPIGEFVMDGVLDTSALLIASNAGINLYARYKSGQLYVATNTAQSQAADMFVFIADERYPLQSAPFGKAGQVAVWSAFLWNESSDNSSGWANATGATQINFTDDAVGAVLEGVIDLEFFYGKSPTKLFISVGKYGTDPSGALLAQVPIGDGNGNIDPSELIQFMGTPPPPTNTYFTQQGNKLVGSGAVNSPTGIHQGNSVDLSADGNTAIVGGPSDNGYAGAAWIYTRSGLTWSQQGNKLVGTGAVGPTRHGFSVAMSADGNTVIIGGIQDNNFVGAAWIYTRNLSGVWSQQGSKLVGTDAVGSAQQGWSVALSSDGNTAIVGGNNDNNGPGAAWIYTRTGNVWSQQGAKLVGSGAISNYPYYTYQGISVALSSDGNTAMVGGHGDDTSKGATWVFVRSGNVWSQQGSKLVGTGAVGAAAQGFSVSLSSDGNTAMIGGRSDNSLTGAVWVFTRTADVWSQQGSKLVGTGGVGIAAQGAAVSLSADGNIALVGGYADSNSAGATWVFTQSGGVWSQQGSKMVGTGAVNTPYSAMQGYSVALSSDGITALVGGPNDATARGAAWVFMRDTPLPIQLGSFTARIVNGNNVRLDWMTVSEINNYGFEVQRSPENGNNYETLPNSFIPGHGTTNEPQYYTFIDVTAPPARWYYRLRQIDLDGTVYYSEGITINTLTGVSGLQLPDEFGLSENYPDPFNPSTTIQYQLPEAAQVTLKIYSILGQEVTTLIQGMQEPGYKSVVWNVPQSGIASGVYFYRIVATSARTTYTATRKMVVMK